MRVLAVATHSERWFPAFVESCRRHDLPLMVLGWGEKWKGFSWRFDLYKAALAQCDPSELVFITDAFDAVFLAGAQEIEAKFHHFGAPILYTAEPKASDTMEWLKSWVWSSYNGRIVNGGTYLGYAGALLEPMQGLKYEHNTDDQALLTALCAKNSSTVDWDGDVCLHWTTFAPSKSMRSAFVAHGRLWAWIENNEWPVCPVLLTSPGGGNGALELVRQLGYSAELAPFVSAKTVLSKVPLVLRELRYIIAGIVLAALVVAGFLFKRSRKRHKQIEQ